MNTQLLLALGLAVGIGVVVLALLLRGRQRPAAPARPAATPAAAPDPAADPPIARLAEPAPDSAAAQLEAQRLAATEALRLARQRKADDATRLNAERAAQARAEAAARALPRPPAPAVAPAVVPVIAHVPASAPASASASTPTPTPTATAPLPQLPAPAAVRRLAPARAPVVALPVQAPAVAPPPRQVVVLLADDSKVVRVKTGRLLEKQGWRVLLAEDGAAALQLLETAVPDLLITDVEMPGLDGFELTRRVRAHPRYGRLPVIMITSSDERHRAEARTAGVNLLLGKPYAEEALLAEVQALLGDTTQRAAAGLALH